MVRPDARELRARVFADERIVVDAKDRNVFWNLQAQFAAYLKNRCRALVKCRKKRYRLLSIISHLP